MPSCQRWHGDRDFLGPKSPCSFVKAPGDFFSFFLLLFSATWPWIFALMLSWQGHPLPFPLYGFSCPASSSQSRRTCAKKPHPKVKSKQVVHSSPQSPVLSESIEIFVQGSSEVLFSDHKSFSGSICFTCRTWVGPGWLFEGTERPHPAENTEQVTSISLAKDFPDAATKQSGETSQSPYLHTP